MKTIEIAPPPGSQLHLFRDAPVRGVFPLSFSPGAADEPLRQSEAGAEDDPGSTRHLQRHMGAEA